MSPVPLASLRRLARKRPAVPAAERCDMCAEPIRDEHDHVVDLRSRDIMCTCHPCHLLFTGSGASLHYRGIPRRYRRLDTFTSDVPVGLYFVFRNTAEKRVVVCYPGPAGATESTLPPGTDLPDLQPDVEAVLVHDDEAYLVPIDVCYELAGRLRKVWRGFDGGREAREEMSRFFTRVRERSAP
jgi:hypothetical protein